MFPASTSSGPAASTASMTARAPSAVVTSPTAGRQSPNADSSATAAPAVFSLRPLTNTTAPSWSSAFAMPLPMPAVEPVTSASLPASFKSIFLRSFLWWDAFYFFSAKVISQTLPPCAISSPKVQVSPTESAVP